MAPNWPPKMSATMPKTIKIVIRLNATQPNLSQPNTSPYPSEAPQMTKVPGMGGINVKIIPTIIANNVINRTTA